MKFKKKKLNNIIFFKDQNKEIVKTLKSSDTYNEVISFFNQ